MKLFSSTNAILVCSADIQFNCDTGNTQIVQYQCTVEEGLVFEWIIQSDDSSCTETYISDSSLNAPKMVSGCPDFNTTLLSITPFKSNISFTVKPNVTGYTIICKDVHGNKTQCKLLGKYFEGK